MDTRWRRSDSETTDIWLPAKGNWLLGSMGGMTATDELDAFRLGAISILLASEAEAVSHGRKEGLDAEKQELGHGKQRRATMQYIWGFPRPDTVSRKRPVITRRLFLNAGVPCHHSAAIPKKASVPCHHSADAARSNSAVTSKTPTSPSITRLLPLKRRRCRQSLGYYL
jgi:hypothetical protein